MEGLVKGVTHARQDQGPCRAFCVSENVSRRIDCGAPRQPGRTRPLHRNAWLALDGNDCEVHRNWCADRSYLTKDGEGLMHEDHCNSDIRDQQQGEQLSLDLQMRNDRRPAGRGERRLDAGHDRRHLRRRRLQRCRNVKIAGDTTRSNGILIQGSPASCNVVKDNRHVGGKGTIHNKAKAKLTGSKGYAT